MKQKKAIRLIKEYARKWTWRLGLRWWLVDLEFYDHPKSIRRIFATDDSEDTVLAVVFAQWQYNTAKVLFNVPGCAKLEPEKLEEVVLHELCHILVNEMREGEKHHEERVVSGLQRAFHWTERDIATEGLA